MKTPPRKPPKVRAPYTQLGRTLGGRFKVVWQRPKGGGDGNRPPWSPLQLSGLVAWWDALAPSTMTLDPSGFVTAWRDRKSGRVLQQANISDCPQWQAQGAANGTAAVVFGAPDGFQANALYTDPAFPILNSLPLTVAASAQVSDTSHLRAICSWNDETANFGGFVYHRFADQSCSFFVNNNKARGDVGLGYANPVFSVGIADGVSVLQNFLDGVEGSLSPASYTPFDTDTNARMTMGGQSPGGLSFFTSIWLGPIQQLVFLQRAISTNERQLLEGWESWYDGKAGTNLPADHPYRHGAPLA